MTTLVDKTQYGCNADRVAKFVSYNIAFILIINVEMRTKNRGKFNKFITNTERKKL